MLVMTIMYGSMYIASGMDDMKEKPVGKRIKTSPAKAYQVFTGIALSSFLLVFMQGLIMIFFTKHVYGVNWGENIVVPIIMVFTMTLLSSSIGMAAAVAIPGKNISLKVLNAVVPAVTAIAGGYVPLPDFGGILGIIQQISPNLYMQNALFNYIFDGSSEKIISAMITIGGMTVLMFAITLFTRRRYSDDSI